MLFKGKIFKSN